MVNCHNCFIDHIIVMLLCLTGFYILINQKVFKDWNNTPDKLWILRYPIKPWIDKQLIGGLRA